jgi:hypothetical protein
VCGRVYTQIYLDIEERQREYKKEMRNKYARCRGAQLKWRKKNMQSFASNPESELDDRHLLKMHTWEKERKKIILKVKNSPILKDEIRSSAGALRRMIATMQGRSEA